MKFRGIASAVAAAGVVFGLAATSFAQAGAVTYKTAQTVTWTANVCGVDYTGWIHEVQQYTLASTGQLNFHYIANGEARGADGTQLKLNNKELDHILQPSVPDLGPYGGLQGWVEDNMDVIVEINAQYNQRIVKPGNGGKTLQNHWVFQVNHNGTTVDSVTFTGSCD
ncbi:MAG: hypothetical protein EPO16_09520 [Dehalococcoidia bacterium]|nr:MAG: hypothetical protein EPO16_09520 [Dehalococcoidia bacterium]